MYNWCYNGCSFLKIKQHISWDHWIIFCTFLTRYIRHNSGLRITTLSSSYTQQAAGIEYRCIPQCMLGNRNWSHVSILFIVISHAVLSFRLFIVYKQHTHAHTKSSLHTVNVNVNILYIHTYITYHVRSIGV